MWIMLIGTSLYIIYRTKHCVSEVFYKIECNKNVLLMMFISASYDV